MKMGKMTWLMMAGCAVMLAALFILPRLGVRLGAFSVFLVLLCPLSHVLMMAFMGKGHSRGQEDGGHGHEGCGVQKPVSNTTVNASKLLLPAPPERN